MVNCEKGKLFPNQKTDEKVFLLIRKHWFCYITFFIMAVLMLIPPIALFSFWSYDPNFFSPDVKFVLVLLACIYFLSSLGLQLYGFINYYYDINIVTDQRIVDISQVGLFKRQISELHLHQVQDVKANVDGFFQTYLNFGDLVIQTAGEVRNFYFQTIPNPYKVAKTIIDLNEKHLKSLDGCKDQEENKGGGSSNGKADLMASDVLDKDNQDQGNNISGDSEVLEEGELVEGQEVDFKNSQDEA